MKTNNTYVNRNFIYMNSRELVTMEQFTEKIVKSVKEKLPENYKVHIDKVLKNNDLEFTSLNILEEGTNVSPCIYLDRYYEYYMEGIDVDSIAKDIIKTYNYFKTPFVDMSFISNFDLVKSRISCKLVNAERNRNLLEEAPHILIYDLPVVFKIDLDMKEFTSQQNKGSVVVKNILSSIWNKTPEELFDIAIKNMPKNYPAQVISLNSLLKQLGVNEKYTNSPMYVCSNKESCLGAITILYPDLLKNFSEKHNCSFYVLPSSIHECLFVPKDFVAEVETLKEMVRDINNTIVYDSEILSDNVYLFDKEQSALILC